MICDIENNELKIQVSSERILKDEGCKTYVKTRTVAINAKQKNQQKKKLPLLKRVLVCSRKYPLVVMDDESYFYLYDTKIPSNRLFFF